LFTIIVLVLCCICAMLSPIYFILIPVTIIGFTMSLILINKYKKISDIKAYWKNEILFTVLGIVIDIPIYIYCMVLVVFLRYLGFIQLIILSSIIPYLLYIKLREKTSSKIEIIILLLRSFPCYILLYHILLFIYSFIRPDSFTFGGLGID
jgi:hypothetical protein